MMKLLTPPHNPSHQPLPLYSTAISAGFPSPADDYIEGKLDLNTYLVRNPAATFFVRVTGTSMINAGIHPNDILIVDRSLEPTSGKIVIAALNGDLVVKRLKKTPKATFFLSENPHYPPITLHEEMDVLIWGVVTNVIHPL